MERQFSLSRFYKFSKIAVIVIGMISLFLAILWSNSSDYREMEALQKNNDYCISKYTDREQIDACYSLENKKYWDSFGSQNPFIIGILLPFVFFAGRFTYKYIFPVKKLP